MQEDFLVAGDVMRIIISSCSADNVLDETD